MEIRVFKMIFFAVIGIHCCVSLPQLENPEEVNELPVAEVIDYEVPEVVDFSKPQIIESSSTLSAPTHPIDEPDHDMGPPAPTTDLPLSNLTTDETEHIFITRKLFGLKMTVVKDWNDDYMNTESETFKNLSKSLGLELSDFVDNALESTVINAVKFDLMQVQPSKDSLHEIYTTFLISSENDIDRDDLSRNLTTHIANKGKIYLIGANLKGFVLEETTRDEVEDLKPRNPECGTDTSISSHNVAEIGSVPAINRKDQKCEKETIQTGMTSIYIFPDQHSCTRNIHNVFKTEDVKEKHSEKVEALNPLPEGKCGKTVKRSADEEEVVIIVKKIGNKVFIEI